MLLLARISETHFSLHEKKRKKLFLKKIYFWPWTKTMAYTYQHHLPQPRTPSPSLSWIRARTNLHAYRHTFPPTLVGTPVVLARAYKRTKHGNWSFFTKLFDKTNKLVGSNLMLSRLNEIAVNRIKSVYLLDCSLSNH
jgi:hypothetical protein